MRVISFLPSPFPSPSLCLFPSPFPSLYLYPCPSPSLHAYPSQREAAEVHLALVLDRHIHSLEGEEGRTQAVGARKGAGRVRRREAVAGPVLPSSCGDASLGVRGGRKDRRGDHGALLHQLHSW